MEIVELRLEDLTPYEKNAKLHPESQVKQIEESIKRFGMNDPIGVWGGRNIIVEGHGRYLACKALGIEKVPCIKLDNLTDAERKEYSLIHNKTTMNSDFDKDILNEELKNIVELDPSIDMSQFDFSMEPVEQDSLKEDDYEIKVPENPNSKEGDLYQLGDHRLYVGNAEDSSSYEKLMAREKADLVITDPPYNVNIENSDGKKIQNDNMASDEFRRFIMNISARISENLKDGGGFYMWFGYRETGNFWDCCNSNGLKVHQELIWVKNHFTLTHLDYMPQHEPCLYGWKEGGHYFSKLRTNPDILRDRDLEEYSKKELLDVIYDMIGSSQTTVINENMPVKDDLHPTMKPVPLIGKEMSNSSKKGEIVLDMFGGSGTTMIAAEQLGRKCRMMEIDPHYADVIIDRWEKFTKKKAVKLNQ